MGKFVYKNAATENLDGVLSPFGSIADEWMLVTAGSGIARTEWNTMTASWGGFGYLWHTPVAYVFVRPTRFTAEFTERQDMISLAFFNSADEQIRSMLRVCGTVSGRDVDKAEETGLVPMLLEEGVIGFEQAQVVLAAKKLYRSEFRPNEFLDTRIIPACYPKKDFHYLYICEITGLYTSV